MKTLRLTKVVVVLYLLLLASFSWSAADSVSSKTFKALTDIQEVMGQGNTDEALSRLTILLTEVEPDTLDQALTLQTLGYVEMAKENFPAAIKHLKASLATKRLPQKVVYNVGYMVAQLHAALNEFDEALVFAEEWFNQLVEAKPAQMIFMANIYAQTKQYEKSIPYAELALASSEAPKETWFQLLTANYFELKKYSKAASTLERMLDKWPEKSVYWEQLASVYLVLEKESHALAVLKIAFLEGLLEKQSTIKSMVQLAVLRGIPEHAGRLIESAMAADLLPEDEDYFEMLAVAYNAAKEREKAIFAYEKMAAHSTSGDPWIAISNIYVEQGEWKNAERALKKALDKKLATAGKAWLLLGISQTEQERFSAAKMSLKKAQAFAETERSASRWLKYADDMRRQSEWVSEFRDAKG